MHIICPHCTTSYAIDLATLGLTGRNVRCSRCKEIWLARPEDATETFAIAPAMAGADQQVGGTAGAEDWGPADREDDSNDGETPVVSSPSISGEWPAEDPDSDWPLAAQHDDDEAESGIRRGRSWFGKASRPPRLRRGTRKPLLNLPLACTAMGALVLALLIWRVDVVRLLPQTAAFYKMVGLEVNLRALLFKDVRITSEAVGGKPLLLIDGVITGENRKTVELPRLRFSVRDGQGAEIYAWNSLLEQPVLKPGDYVRFKSRLASPPAEGRSIDIRFFSKRDVAGRGA
ncbi:MAG TPA: MJ0042-type zinc finger domain-containing protein [Bradyrhizobium sp.]|nr:MJ0042-type zinc finger domain-containing protein [Bradyrhizobium sp.]